MIVSLGKCGNTDAMQASQATCPRHLREDMIGLTVWGIFGGLVDVFY